MSEDATPRAQSNAHAHTTFRRMWADLAPIGRDAATGGYRRFAWTREATTLSHWFHGEAHARGLTVTRDRNGNEWAWWGDPDAAVARAAATGDPHHKGIVLGSHLDSVPDGGAFDGPLGVVSAFAALDEVRAHLAAQGITQPDRPIAVAHCVDEEGARFGVACAGSRLATGVLDPDRARALTDANGTTLAEAMRRAGHDPDHIGRDDETLARIGAWVELHVEQGRHLSHLTGPDASAVAVGSEIWPHGRWRIDVPGEANHAGTTRLEDRDDAMLGAALAVIAARRLAEEHGCVATVGKLHVTPGGVNAIPAATTAWLDARGADADRVTALVAALTEVVADADAVVTQESWTPATAFDVPLRDRLAARLSAQPDGSTRGIPVIGTGAGHDAGIFTNAGVRSAMLFVRNPTGVSHSPAEWAEEDDCVAGIHALAAVALDLVTSVSPT